jgi:hypothetical protein
MFAYSNNGLSFRAVDPNYQPQASEILFADYATPAQLASAFPGLAAAASAQQAAAKPRPTPREWLERLSPTTQLALETAALSNAQVALWLRKATGAGTIDVTLLETQQGVAAMVAAGLLTAAEQTVLLNP